MENKIDNLKKFVSDEEYKEAVRRMEDLRRLTPSPVFLIVILEYLEITSKEIEKMSKEKGRILRHFTN